MNQHKIKKKGLDIAFGEEGRFGGILIRSLQKIGKKETICGPSLVVDNILKKNAMKSISDLVEKFGISILEGENEGLYIKKEKIPNLKMYSSARVGLTLKNKKSEQKPELFIMRNYRYFTDPKSISKHKHLMAISMSLVHNLSQPEICQITGSKKNSVSEWIDHANKGKRKAFSKFYGTSKYSNQLVCQLYGSTMRHTYFKDQVNEDIIEDEEEENEEEESE